MNFDEILAASHTKKGPLGAAAFTIVTALRQSGAPPETVATVEAAIGEWLPQLDGASADTLVAVLQHRFEALSHRDAYTDLVRLKGQLTAVEAHLAHDALEQQGIFSRLAHQRSGAAIIPGLENEVELWVRPDTLAAAEGVLERLRPNGKTATCPACKEESPAHFAFCWACGGAMTAEAESAN